MEEQNGGFIFGRGSEEDGEIAVGVGAASDAGGWRLIDAQALGAECDATLGVDTGL